MKNEITLQEVDDLIEIRSDPHIYVFSTNTVPNYVKVGDTFRPIETRLKEWKEIYNDIIKLFPNINNEIEAISKINNDIYFRDYSLHKYLENNNFHRLIKSEFTEKFGNNAYFSNEFFENVPIDEIINGIRDIKQGYEKNNQTYQYYRIENKQAVDTHWKNDKDWKLRENQEKVVNNFCEKLKTTEKEFLMYAVMRFGKSFTALSCAQKNKYKKVLVVSAKADVASEWKKTVEMPICFKNYAFLCDRDFVNNSNIIEEVLKKVNQDEYLKSKDSVVVFLTLQNLSGKDSNGNNIKEKLQKVYNTNFDMIIIDETHYGAWANSYGRPLNNKEEDEGIINSELKNLSKMKEETDKIKGEIKLHLSGTPYNLLYNQKFSDKNIIATCQFSDILKDKEKWYEKHKIDIDSGKINPETNRHYEEFDNPYFGFPKMLRFAFSIPSATQAKLLTAQSKGNKWTLNDFLITNKTRENTKFIYEEDVLKLLNIIDGKEQDEHILSFLNIPKIKDNQVCKHIVMVLPYKYSCDAMEQLLIKNADNFINLKNYKILNITGHNVTKENESIESVKNTIKESEKQGIKTITLTVNKMLTGVTVPEWDTMIMLKNTKSPQEYDQAIFRIQNQYVKEITSVNENNETDIVKIDMKPQTILVDFDPARMFELQGLSTKIVNKVKKDQIDLDDALKTELKYFPIIANNADKLVLVTPTNIVEVITNYNKNISILESSGNANLDFNMLSNSDIQNFINSQSSKGIITRLSGEMHKGKNTDIDTGNIEDESDDDNNPVGAGQTNSTENKESETVKDLKEKYRKCIACLMFYAFLTKSKINSMQDIINSIEKDGEFKADNNRIFTNLLLNKKFIKNHISLCQRQFAIDIDNLLSQANLLSQDGSLSPGKRVENALARFSRISESEIVTPINICDEMFNSIGNDKLVTIVKNKGKVLDIAGKTGEFAISLYNSLKNKVEDNLLKNCIYTIPTSSVTYELTRKIYEILGLNIDNIATQFNSYDLLDITVENKKDIDYNRIENLLTQNKKFSEIKINDEVQEGGEKVKFEAIVGNPPYQEEKKINSSTNGQNPRTNIFQHFQIFASKLAKNYTCLIYPGTRWIHQSGKGLNAFGKELINDPNLEILIFFPNSNDIFKSTDIPDGISIVLLNKNKSTKNFRYKFISKKYSCEIILESPGDDLLLLNPKDLTIVQKIKEFVNKYKLEYLHDKILPRSLFGIESDFVENNQDKIRPINKKEDLVETETVKLFTNDKAGSAGRANWYLVNKDLIPQNIQYIYEWQVVVSSAHPGGQHGRDNQLEIIDNKSAFGRSRVALKTFKSSIEAKNFKNFMSTDVVKYCLLMSGEALSSLAKFVPDLMNYKDSTIVNFDKDINIQLIKLIGLKDEELLYIKSLIK